MKERIYIDTLGCKLNQAETEKLINDFEDCGYKNVLSAESADVYILNTCTVTHVADRKSRQMLRAVRRNNTEVTVIALGCYCDAARAELMKMPEVDYVFGNAEKKGLVKILREKGLLGGQLEKDKDNGKARRIRSFVKVEEGCDNFCSYCVVPYVRGKPKSVSVEEIVHQINFRHAKGFKEVVLTGTEIGSYDYKGSGLKDLLNKVLKETGIERLRVSSLQPQHIDEELLKLWSNQRLCNNFHLSLQSGSDTVLKRMNRNYDTERFTQAVKLIREHLPQAGITTDVITAFPAETEQEFEQSAELCRKMKFSRVHVFPFSKRRGTGAALMAGQITENIKKKRTNRMLAIARRSLEQFNNKYRNTLMEVLWEQKDEAGFWHGLTANYIRVYFCSNENLSNRITQVRLRSAFKDGMLAEKE